MASWRWSARTGGHHTASGARFSRTTMAGAALAVLVVGFAVPAVALVNDQAGPDPQPAAPVAAAPVALTQASLTSVSPGAIDVLFGLGRPAAQSEVAAPAAAPPDLAGAPDLGAVPVAAVDPASVLASGFIRPVDGPITSRFGPRFHPILKVWKLHTGTDIGAACGTPVKAAKDGTVTFAGVAGGDGNRVVIDHGNGLASTYNHLSAYAATVGLTVRQGQVIGYVGTTGLSTGCHLHFEVLVNGVLVDSGPYLDLAPATNVTIPAAVPAVSAATTAAPAAKTPAAAAPPAPAAAPSTATSTPAPPSTATSTSPTPPTTTSSPTSTATASCPSTPTTPAEGAEPGACPSSTHSSASTSTKSSRSASGSDAASATGAVAP